MRQETITLTEAEMKKVLVIEKVIARQFTVREAAERLELSKPADNPLKENLSTGRSPRHSSQEPGT
jgi:hypothetical protein